MSLYYILIFLKNLLFTLKSLKMNIKYFEQIEDYINGDLKGAEFIQFQEALQADIELQKAVDSLEEEFQIICEKEHQEDPALKALMTELDIELNKEYDALYDGPIEKGKSLQKEDNIENMEAKACETEPLHPVGNLNSTAYPFIDSLKQQPPHGASMIVALLLFFFLL